MANWWNNRLVVHGPRADVEKFRRAARVEPVRRRRSRTGKGRPRKRAGTPLLLSFDKLVESLPASVADGVERAIESASLSSRPTYPFCLTIPQSLLLRADRIIE